MKQSSDSSPFSITNTDCSFGVSESNKKQKLKWPLGPSRCCSKSSVMQLAFFTSAECERLPANKGHAV